MDSLGYYIIKRTNYFTCFQFFPCCKTLEPSWVEKMRFASSYHAKTLLKCTDALPDGMVFDQKLQDQVMRSIIGQEDESNDDPNRKNSSGAFRLVRTKTLSIKNITKSDIINSNDIITYETSHEFFSTINSEKTLSLVINTIFEIVSKKTKKSKDIESFQSNNVAYDKIWKLYKHTKEERNEKEESRVAGNHVRNVMKPMEDRMIRMDKRLKGMETEMQEMKDKMDQILMLLKSN